MQPGSVAQRHQRLGDVVFAVFLLAYALLSISLLPYDFTDLCYLFSLEQGRWVTQEWVHPIYVPTLDLLRNALALVGYHGPMLMPTELLNVAASLVAFALLYRLARRFPVEPLIAAAALAVTAFCTGFWSATVRPTPYALALLCQVLCLSSLVADRPVGPRRYALAGAMAGLAMGLHASAMALAVVGVVCALLEPDPARTVWATTQRVLAFGGAMLAVAVGGWGIFLAYRSIGPAYFERQEFWSLFTGIEQVPGSSIYTSGSVTEQLTTFVRTMGYQTGALFRAAVVCLAAVAVLRVWRRMPLTAHEQRLAVATGANLAAIGGFFLINNTHNGFIFASMTLVPVLVAVALRHSWVGLAVFAFLTVPHTVREVTYALLNNTHGANDPMLAEVRFLQRTLGPRDVVLTPGSPFPEMFYLSHLNLIEVSTDSSTHPGTDVPLAHPGPVLRARIAWWLDNGGRVFYAVGDESTDFTGDVGGAEKGRQIFWRPETAAAERAPKLQSLRAALETSGLELHDGPISPNGERYAEVAVRESVAPIAQRPPTTNLPAPSELRRLFLAVDGRDAASPYPHRAQFLANLGAAIPGDPWLVCDVMDLVCEGQPQRGGDLVPCRQLPGCDPIEQPLIAIHHVGKRTAGKCFWAPVSDRQPVEDYLIAWTAKHRLGRLADWGFSAEDKTAELVLVLSDGRLTVDWPLLDSCDAGDVDAKPADGLRADAVSAAQLRELVEGLPVPKVRPGSGRNAVGSAPSS